MVGEGNNFLSWELEYHGLLGEFVPEISQVVKVVSLEIVQFAKYEFDKYTTG